MAKKAKKGYKVLSEAALAKKYQRSGTASDVILDTDKMPWLPSRFLALNDLLGGGIPFGKVLEIYGEESSGKSLLAYDFAYCAQALGGIVLWADAEFSYSKRWAIQNGLDNDVVIVYKETAIENISDWSADQIVYWRSKLLNNEPILLIIDSLAGLECLSNIGVEQVSKKAEMGNRAKKIGEYWRLRHPLYEDLGVSVIAINQLRKKIGVSNFEDPDTTPGGAATKFFASQRLAVYGGRQIKEKIRGYETRVGRVSTIRSMKNKVAPPRPTIKAAPMIFHEESKLDIGFDKYFWLEEVLLRTEVLTKKKGGSSYKFKDKTIAVGKDKLIKLLRKDAKLRSKLLRRSGVNTISRTKKLLESLDENLYSIKGITVESQK